MDLIRVSDPLHGGSRVTLMRETGIPKCDEATELCVRLKDELDRAYESLEAARANEREVVAADRGDLAAWHLAGGKGKRPSDAKVLEARVQLEAADREYEGLGNALSTAVRQADALREEHRAEWLEVAQAQEAEQRALYAAALGTLLEQRAAWFKAASIITMIDGRKVAPAGGNLEGKPWAQIEEALKRESGLERKPVTLAEHVAHMAEHGVPFGPDGRPSPTMNPAAA